MVGARAIRTMCSMREMQGCILKTFTPVHEQNFLSLDNLSESVFQTYLQCVDDCYANDIPTMVIHLPDDSNPLDKIGIEHLKTIISQAENKNFR